MILHLIILFPVEKDKSLADLHDQLRIKSALQEKLEDKLRKKDEKIYRLQQRLEKIDLEENGNFFKKKKTVYILPVKNN